MKNWSKEKENKIKEEVLGMIVDVYHCYDEGADAYDEKHWKKRINKAFK